jgi:hypothetical protein
VGVLTEPIVKKLRKNRIFQHTLMRELRALMAVMNLS